MERVTEQELFLLRHAQVNLNNMRAAMQRAEKLFNAACDVVWAAHKMVPHVDEVDLDTGDIVRK